MNQNPQGTPPDTDTPPVINAEWLSRMREKKPEFLRRLFGVFLEEEPKRLAQLAQAVAAGDMEQTRYLAHSLKGAAATMGLERLRDASRELEFAAKEGDDGRLSAGVPVVEHEFNAALAFMRAEIAAGS